MELPPRQILGADSKSLTEQPASLAINAAHSAALPPPMTNTSSDVVCFNSFSFDFFSISSSALSTVLGFESRPLELAATVDQISPLRCEVKGFS
jgi:hypothetical protein